MTRREWLAGVAATAATLPGRLAAYTRASGPELLRALDAEAGEILTGPVDRDVWAVVDPSGPHFIPTAAWR